MFIFSIESYFRLFWFVSNELYIKFSNDYESHSELSASSPTNWFSIQRHHKKIQRMSNKKSLWHGKMINTLSFSQLSTHFGLLYEVFMLALSFWFAGFFFHLFSLHSTWWKFSLCFAFKNFNCSAEIFFCVFEVPLTAMKVPANHLNGF